MGMTRQTQDTDRVFSKETEIVTTEGVKMPRWVGRENEEETLKLHGDSTITNPNDDLGREVIYTGLISDTTEEHDGIEKYVTLTFTQKRTVEVYVEKEAIEYDEENGYWDMDTRELIEKDRQEYESVGWAFRRLLRETGIDPKEENINIRFK